MGGYVILSDDGATLYYKKVSNSYNGTTGYTEEELPAKLKGEKQFFELYLSHGVSSSDGTVENNSYFYAYLPEATVEQTNAYYSAPDVELLARSGKAHAVIEKTLNIVACNFFEEDLATVKVGAKYSDVTAVKSISAETPCSVMITKGENGEYMISVSDPTQLYRNTILSINISGVTQIVSKDDEVKASFTEDGELSILVNTQGSLGQTYNLTVK